MEKDDLSDFHGRRQLRGAVTGGVEAVEGIPVRWVAADAPQGVALWLTYLGGVRGDPYIDQINAMPTYVASQALTEVTWNVAENLFQRR